MTDLLPEMHPPGSRTSLSLCCLQCPVQKSSDTPETLGKDSAWESVGCNTAYCRVCIEVMCEFETICNAEGFKQ